MLDDYRSTFAKMARIMPWAFCVLMTASSAGWGQDLKLLPPLPKSDSELNEGRPAESPESQPEPSVLRNPLANPRRLEDLVSDDETSTELDTLLVLPRDNPIGFAGPSGIVPTEIQQDSHFVPIEDRWRIGVPQWDRHERGHPLLQDYQYAPGSMWDSYRQNVLKGDYPLFGQDVFLKLSAESITRLEGRQLPTPTTPAIATGDPSMATEWGDPDRFLLWQSYRGSIDLFRGDAGFRQPDWRLKITPIWNLNHRVADELGVVGRAPNSGTARFRQDFAVEEWFVESRLADTSPYFDFVSVRGGSQVFVSDFAGFIFSDANRAVRLFGTRSANRDQFNVVWVDHLEKDTNSFLNTFRDRHQTTLIANYYRQDLFWPGYFAQISVHHTDDHGGFELDKNGNQVRPVPLPGAEMHTVRATYAGWTGFGHIGRINVNHAFYWAFGEDTMNPLAGRPVDISALMGAIELSIDLDWLRLTSAYFVTSGDSDPTDNRAEGFDTILDNPVFAGGRFSYWQRQPIPLFGVNLVNQRSLVPNLRSSKLQGQPNFVNPGLHLVSFSASADMTPKSNLIGTVNWMWFDQTEVFTQLLGVSDVDSYLGTDLSLGLEYRPWLDNRIIVSGGVASLIGGKGFRDLYRPFTQRAESLFGGFANIVVGY